MAVTDHHPAHLIAEIRDALGCVQDSYAGSRRWREGELEAKFDTLVALLVETDTPKLIAELHAAGYSNAKIGYLLAQHGLSEPISEATVRRWAMRKGDPRLSQWNALQSLHAAVITIVKVDEACSAEK